MGFDAAALARILQRPGYRIVGEAPVVPSVPSAPVLCASCARPVTTQAEPLTLILPYPPSNNKRLTPVNGRQVLTVTYRSYRQAALVAVAQQWQGRAPLTGRLVVTLVMHAPDHRRRDTDGVEKVAWDALQAAGVYCDDEQIDERHVYRGTVQQPGHVRITLAELQLGGPHALETSRTPRIF